MLNSKVRTRVALVVGFIALLVNSLGGEFTAEQQLGVIELVTYSITGVGLLWGAVENETKEK